MALERIGLGGVLTADSKEFVKGVGNARNALGQFLPKAKPVPGVLGRITAAAQRMGSAMRKGGKRIAEGTAKIGQGLRKATLAAAPLTFGLFKVTKTAATFQQAMSGVQAVALASKEEMVELTAKAKEMGIKTAFSATQAAEGMQFMKRAGFENKEVMTGLEAVLHAAAAEGMTDLGLATDIVANVLKGMNLQATDATRVADVLALTSARTNTNMVELGFGFSQASATAKIMGVSFESTAGALGLLADAGVKGTAGATAFKNSLLKLARPSKKSTKLMHDLGIKIVENKDGTLDFMKTMKSAALGLKKIDSRVERAAASMEIFGKRGMTALSAFDTAIESGKFDELDAQLQNAAGSAEKMAKIRLDNLAGSVQLFKSSIEAASIAVGGPLLGSFNGLVKDATAGLNNVLFAMSAVTAAAGDQDKIAAATEKFGSTAVAVATGINEAIESIKRGIKTVVESVKAFGARVAELLGPDGVRKLTKFAITFATIAAAVVPVMLALGGLVFLVKSVMIPLFVGLKGVILGAIWPVLVPLGIVILVLKALQKENEKLGDTAKRVFLSIKKFVLKVWKEGIKPFIDGIKTIFIPMIETLGEIWNETIAEVKSNLSGVFGANDKGTTEMVTDWKEVGRVIGAIFATIVEVVGRAVSGIVILVTSIPKIVKEVADKIWQFLTAPFRATWKLVNGLVDGIKEIFSGNIISGLKKMGRAILDFLLSPMKAVVREMIALAEAVGAEGLVPDRLYQFAGVPKLSKAKTEAEFIAEQRAQQTGKKFDRAAFRKKQAGGRTAEQVFHDREKAGQSQAKIQDIAGKRAKNNLAILKKVNDLVTKGKVRKAKPPETKVDIDLTDKRCLDINNNLSVDSEAMSIATERKKVELQERSGFKSTPWQRRQSIEQGATTNAGPGRS